MKLGAIENCRSGAGARTPPEPPEGRFKGDPIGLGAVDHAALIGLSKLPKGHGVLDPGELLSLIA